MLVGATGNDELFGISGNDILDGGEGTDSVDGGDGSDACLGETPTSCESSSPASSQYAHVLGFASVQPGGKAVESAVAEIKATFNFTFNFQP